MTKTTKPKQTTREERQDLLERLWAAHTRKLVEKIEKTPATELDAATFNAAAKMLAENGITADALNKDNAQVGKTLAEQARSLQLADDMQALHGPVPVPPNTEEVKSALKRLEES